MAFAALKVISTPYPLASARDPGIDWSRTADAMEIDADATDREAQAMARYVEGLDVTPLVPKVGDSIAFFQARMPDERTFDELSAEASAWAERRGGAVQTASSRMQVLMFRDYVERPKGQSAPIIVRTEIGGYVVRLAQTSISEEVADDVGKRSGR